MIDSMVGPPGLEPETSTVSRLNPASTCGDPDTKQTTSEFSAESQSSPNGGFDAPVQTVSRTAELLIIDEVHFAEPVALNPEVVSGGMASDVIAAYKRIAEAIDHDIESIYSSRPIRAHFDLDITPETQAVTKR